MIWDMGTGVKARCPQAAGFASNESARPRSRTRAFLLFMLALVCASEAAAQPWKPTRNVEIIVGSGPGGGADITGRLMQKLFQEKLLPEVATSVVNKTGGGSTLSSVYLNQHPGDAHFIALTLQPMITGPLMIAGQIAYTDMTPLAHLINEYVDAPYKTGRDVIERLKKDPASSRCRAPSGSAARSRMSRGRPGLSRNTALERTS